MFFYTTNELRIPTKNTRKIHAPRPEKIVPLFSTHPSGYANITGTPITNENERTTSEKVAS